MKYTISILLSLILVGCSTFSNKIDIHYHKQQGQSWCWAATTGMLMHHFSNLELDDCEIASIYSSFMLFEPKNCCEEKDCEWGLTAEEVSQLLRTLGLRFTSHWGDVSYNNLVLSLDKGSIYLVAVRIEGQSSHLMLLTGYEYSLFDKKIHILDPISGEEDIDYSAITSKPNDEYGRWIYTWKIDGYEHSRSR